MSSDNPTADRLLNDARKKTAALESPLFAQIALGLGAIGVLSAWWIPLSGWVLGAIAAVLGGISLQRGTAKKLAQIALVVGVLSILLATFRFTLFISQGY